jgi:predicted nucleic acid-binding protein
MKRKVFIDTSAWVNIVNRDIPLHQQAVEIYTRLLSENVMFVTTGFILAEVHVILRRKIGYATAQEFLQKINDSARVQVVYPGLSTETAAKSILEKYADQDFSLTDAINFAFMHETGITEAFSYDHHFATAGFLLVNPFG